MLKWEEIFMIKQLKNQGMSLKDIADVVDRDVKTIRKYIKANKIPDYKRSSTKPSKLEVLKEYILKRMLKDGCTNSVLIFEKICEKGYKGKLTILRDFMKPYRKSALSMAVKRFETPPGKQAQVNWGEFKAEHNGKTIKLHCFVMVLGFSRKMYIEFTEDEKIETLIGCHERAFQYFDGVPETILYNNMRTVVKDPSGKGDQKWNNKFSQFAEHSSFSLIRCRPYSPRTKGKVENGVKYVRRNFWPRISRFRSLADLNEKGFNWLKKASLRVHGTTKEVPEERFKLENLKSLPVSVFNLSYVEERRVSTDCFVTFLSNRYSVPSEHVQEKVKVKNLKNGMIGVYSLEGIQIALHEKLEGKNKTRHKKEHFKSISQKSQSTVAYQAPKLIPEITPEVQERPLSIYEEVMN